MMLYFFYCFSQISLSLMNLGRVPRELVPQLDKCDFAVQMQMVHRRAGSCLAIWGMGYSLGSEAWGSGTQLQFLKIGFERVCSGAKVIPSEAPTLLDALNWAQSTMKDCYSVVSCIRSIGHVLEGTSQQNQYIALTIIKLIIFLHIASLWDLFYSQGIESTPKGIWGYYRGLEDMGKDVIQYCQQILLMLGKKEEDTTAPVTKRSYSYNDLIKMQSDSAYNTIGRVIPSQKPSAPRATFGNSERKNFQKLLSEQRLMKTITGGKEGHGPAAYLPSRYTNQFGKQQERADIDAELKYASTPSYSIGKGPRKGEQLPVYNYMHSKNDDIELNNADLKRRNSTPCIRIGTDSRFPEQRTDKITPGPTYDPKLRPDAQEAPKYTLGARRAFPGKDPLTPAVGTTNLVSPATYFQKGSKSHSTSSLSRVPYDSKLKNQPVVSFTKGPKSLAQYKNSVDETYDIKTKTILAHYDFQYDAGKGLNSGRAWDKKYLGKCSQMPLERNKMKSFTIGKTSRQRQQKRGTFVSMMSQVQTSVRMNHPKF